MSTPAVVNLETAPAPTPTPLATPSRRPQALILIGTWLIAAWMLFAGLGHYALWDDESYGALMAKSILATGDTKAQIGHNLLAYRDGLVLHNLRTEGEAPFVPYLVAPFLAVFGETAFAARLPLALLGFGTVTLMLWWVWTVRAGAVSTGVFALALLGNTSFYLYSRNCRYYAVTMACFTLVAWLHLHRKGRWWEPWAMGATGAALLLSHYTLFICLCACLLVDTLFWERNRRPYPWRELAQAAVLPFLAGLAVIAWWNPLRTGIGKRLVVDSLLQKLTLFGWHWRDMDRSEMLVAPVLAAAVVLACFPRFRWLRRGVVALFVYSVVLTALSIQTVTDTTLSDIRYFAGALPLIIAIQAYTVAQGAGVLGWRNVGILVLAGALFLTNLANGIGWPMKHYRSTPVAFANEVKGNFDEPYTALAEWINTHVKEGQTINIQPLYMAYPLMYHAPHALYAWQISPKKRAQFPELGDIHFSGNIPPDFFIINAPSVGKLIENLERWQRATYRVRAILPIYWRDHYRPEVFVRTFIPIPVQDPKLLGIYIFERVTGPQPPPLLQRQDSAGPGSP